MKKPTPILATALLLISAGTAIAGSCPMDLKQIDAALAANPSLSASDLDRVRELRDSGEQLHNSGNHADSVARLNEAKQLLGI